MQNLIQTRRIQINMGQVAATAMIMHIKTPQVVRVHPLEPQNNRRLWNANGLGIVKFGMHGHDGPRVICFPQGYPTPPKIPAQVAEVF